MHPHHLSPTKILMFSLSALSIIMVASSTSWIYTWLALELNMFTFLPIICWTSSKWIIESTIKYFIIQSTASTLFLISTLMMSNYTSSLFSTLLMTTMLMKLASAPFHQWLIMIVKPLTWLSLLMLLTWQKISPLIILLSMNTNTPAPFLLLSALNVTWGAVGGLNQSHFRPLLAFSSISHMGWVLISTPQFLSSAMIYFLIYSTTTTLFILSIYNNTNFKFWWAAKSHHNWDMSMMINMLSLAGLPPLLGFMGKWMIISSTPPTLLIFLILLMSILTLFFYLTIFINWMLSPPSLPLLTNPLPLLNKISILMNLFLAPFMLII